MYILNNEQTFIGSAKHTVAAVAVTAAAAAAAHACVYEMVTAAKCIFVYVHMCIEALNTWNECQSVLI